MFKLFGILLLAFAFTGVLLVPFIDLLYKMSFRYKRVRVNDTQVASLSKLHEEKVGTPTGGGILMVTAAVLFIVLFYSITNYAVNWTSVILFGTMIVFGGLGFYDDLRKMVRVHGKKITAFPILPKLIAQIVAGLLIGYLLLNHLGTSAVTIPMGWMLFGINSIDLGIWFIPFAALVIVSSSNAFNITDGLDGLATGLLLIALSVFWYLASDSSFSGDVILFIAVMMGVLLAFLYFNIFPARLFMGDTGSLALGAMIAVVALITDHALVLPIVGGMFVLELFSSVVQIMSKKLRNGKKVFEIAPIHFHFQAKGWDETKVTMRFWLAGAILAFIGLFVASIS